MSPGNMQPLSRNATPSSSKSPASSLSKNESRKPHNVHQPLVIVTHPTESSYSRSDRSDAMEPHPGLLSQVEAQHRINRYQSLEISSQRHQITALTEQATAAAAGLTTADLDRREAIARYDLLHADYAIKITQVQHLRAALQQRDAAIRRQQDEIAALEKRVRDLQQDLTIPAQEAETMAAPPSVITPPPSRGRLSQMAAASVPSLPAQLAKFGKELRRKASSDNHTTSPREKFASTRETKHAAVRELPTAEGESKPMTLPARLLKRATLRNQLEGQVWPQLGLTAQQKERRAERERAKAEEEERVREEAREEANWPLR